MSDPSWSGMANAELATRVGDLRQLAAVRRIVLDDGPERGVRALSFSTGGGLDFWVFSDRSFDIGPLWWRGTQIAWQGPAGFVSPSLMDPERWGGHGFAQGLGGFLVTAGLEHIRQPQDGHPLHGRLPFTPGRLLAYGEDWNGPDGPLIFCEGEIVLMQPGGGYRMRRRIEAPIGGRTLRLRDEIENLSAREQPLALLYHMNLGFPLITEGTTVALRDGKPIIPPIASDVGGGRPVVECVAAHDPTGTARCVVACPGAVTEAPRRLIVDFDSGSMPWLQIWRDPAPRRRILGIEPATSERLPDGTSAAGPSLLPGEAMHFGFDLILDDAAGDR